MNSLYSVHFSGLNSALDDYENKEIVVEASSKLDAEKIWSLLREKHKLTCGDYEWKEHCSAHPLKIYRDPSISGKKDDPMVQMIIRLENGLLKSHLTGDPTKKLHTCNFCRMSNNWHESIVHDPECPLSILSEMRNSLNIPNWLGRELQGDQ